MKDIYNIKAKDIMNKNVITINPNNTILNAAKLMKQYNIGCLPVVNKNKLLGIITDRDIIIKAITNQANFEAQIKNFIENKIIAVNKNDDISIAISKMADYQVRRIMVTDNNDRLEGIISISDIANNVKTNLYIQELLTEILLPNSIPPFLIINNSHKV